MSRGGVHLPDTCSNYYELLGLIPFEADVRLVDSKVRNLMREARKYQVGPYAEQAEKHLNLLSAARTCLLDETQKRKYDEKLRQELGLPPIVLQATIPAELAAPLKAGAASVENTVTTGNGPVTATTSAEVTSVDEMIAAWGPAVDSGENGVPAGSQSESYRVTVSDEWAPPASQTVGSAGVQDTYWEPKSLFPADDGLLVAPSGGSVTPVATRTAGSRRAASTATLPRELAEQSAPYSSVDSPLGLPGEMAAYPQIVVAQQWLEERVQKIRSHGQGVTTAMVAVALLGGVVWFFCLRGDSTGAANAGTQQDALAADELSLKSDANGADSQRTTPADRLTPATNSDDQVTTATVEGGLTRKDFRTPEPRTKIRIDPLRGNEVALNEPGSPRRVTGVESPGEKVDSPSPDIPRPNETTPNKPRLIPKDRPTTTPPVGPPPTGVSPADSKPLSPLPNETKPGETKPGETKPGDVKPEEPKPVDPTMKKPETPAETPSNDLSEPLGEDAELKLTQTQVLAKLKTLRLNTIKAQGAFGLRSHTESLKIIQYAQATFKNDRRFMTLLEQEIKSQVRVFPFLRGALDQAE